MKEQILGAGTQVIEVVRGYTKDGLPMVVVFDRLAQKTTGTDQFVTRGHVLDEGVRNGFDQSGLRTTLPAPKETRDFVPPDSFAVSEPALVYQPGPF